MTFGVLAAIIPTYARDVRRLSARNGHMSFAEWRKHDRRRQKVVTPWKPASSLQLQDDHPYPSFVKIDAVNGDLW